MNNNIWFLGSSPPSSPPCGHGEVSGEVPRKVTFDFCLATNSSWSSPARFPLRGPGEEPFCIVFSTESDGCDGMTILRLKCDMLCEL